MPASFGQRGNEANFEMISKIFEMVPRISKWFRDVMNLGNFSRSAGHIITLYWFIVVVSLEMSNTPDKGKVTEFSHP